MTSKTPLASAGSRVAVVLIAAALLAGSTAAERDTSFAVTPPTAGKHPRPVTGLPVPAALTSNGLSMRAGPVAVPIQLAMPSIDVYAAVLGVGVTPKNVMDAPMGEPNDPVWQQAFWYRGSAVPGVQSTALIAGHIEDPVGRPGVFGHIDRLRPGDPIVVHDTRTGLDVVFSVASSESYTLEQAADPELLRRIYGEGPVTGRWSQPSVDGLAHLTLVTCAGIFSEAKGTHDRRLVVYATRTG